MILFYGGFLKMQNIIDEKKDKIIEEAIKEINKYNSFIIKIIENKDNDYFSALSEYHNLKFAKEQFINTINSICNDSKKDMQGIYRDNYKIKLIIYFCFSLFNDYSKIFYASNKNLINQEYIIKNIETNFNSYKIKLDIYIKNIFSHYLRISYYDKINKIKIYISENNLKLLLNYLFNKEDFFNSEYTQVEYNYAKNGFITIKFLNEKHYSIFKKYLMKNYNKIDTLE